MIIALSRLREGGTMTQHTMMIRSTTASFGRWATMQPRFLFCFCRDRYSIAKIVCVGYRLVGVVVSCTPSNGQRPRFCGPTPTSARARTRASSGIDVRIMHVCVMGYYFAITRAPLPTSRALLCLFFTPYKASGVVGKKTET